MKRNKALTTGIGLLVAVTGAFGLTACGSGPAAAPRPPSSETQATAGDGATATEHARTADADALAEDDSWAQIMLASDVKEPTVKYGLLVVPFVPSDAASRVQGTVDIKDGKYTIEADSAETGETWQIDQDGTITPAGE